EPATAAQEASTKEAPRPAVVPRERRSPSDHLQVATATGLGGARPPRARSYWVQVGAFKNPEAAQRLATLLVEQKPSASDRFPVVVELGPPGAPLSRVRVGPF